MVRWPMQIYLDAPFAASGPIPRDVAPFFKPPYREWWNFTKVAAVYAARICSNFHLPPTTPTNLRTLCRHVAG